MKKKIYNVVLDNQIMFSGTKTECVNYLDNIHPEIASQMAIEECQYDFSREKMVKALNDLWSGLKEAGVEGWYRNSYEIIENFIVLHSQEEE